MNGALLLIPQGPSDRGEPDDRPEAAESRGSKGLLEPAVRRPRRETCKSLEDTFLSDSDVETVRQSLGKCQSGDSFLSV